MQREEVSGNLERQFLAGLTHSKAFLSGAAPTTDPTLLRAKNAQLLAGWCLDYWRDYGQAPGTALRAVCAAWAQRENPPEADVDAASDLVEAVAELPEPTNVPHLLGEFSNHLTRRKLENLQEIIAAGDTEYALTAVQEFRTVNVGDAVGYAPMLGKGAIKRAFAEPIEPLINFPTSMNWFFRGAFTRDALVGVQMGEKTGKTRFLIDICIRAIQNHRTVAFFQTGDLTDQQLNERWFQRISGIPTRPWDCKAIKYPTKIEVVETEKGRRAKVEFSTRSYPVPLDEHSANRARLDFNRKYKVDVARPTLLFSCHPNTTINVRGIDGILRRWRQELNFTADLVLIDYADILAPENPREEFRHQQNTTWKALRRLSQEWRACVVVPTQADAGSYTGKLQTAKNFSEDKRKYAHVTAMLAGSQTPAEKEQQVLAFNWLMARSFNYNPLRRLWVAGCPVLDKPMVLAAKG